MATEVDESLGIRNLYHLGSLQQVVNDATNPATAPKSDSSRKSRQVLLYRAYLAQSKYNILLSEIPASTDNGELLAIRVLSKFFQSGQSSAQGREDAVEEMKGLVGGAGVTPTMQVLAATLFFQVGDYEMVLRLAVQAPRNLESVALAVQAYLKLDRADLAKKEVAALKTWADDATLAQLVEAWVSIFVGGEQKYQEAYYIFEELASSHLITAKLLTGQAVCRMHAGKFADAETLLLEALDRNNNDPEVLANLVVCATCSGKPTDVAARYLSQLQDASPNHPFVQEYASKAAMFDRASAKFRIPV